MVFRRVDFGPQQLLPPHRIALMSSRRLLPSPWYDLGLGFPGFLAGDGGKVLTICWVMGSFRLSYRHSITLVPAKILYIGKFDDLTHPGHKAPTYMLIYYNIIVLLLLFFMIITNLTIPIVSKQLLCQYYC